MTRRLFSLAMIALIGGGALVGCEASGRVGDDDDADYRRTTTVEEDGDTVTETRTRTEIRRDVD